MSLNKGTLLNGISRPRLLNNSFPSCSFIILDYFIPHTGLLDDNIGLPYLFITSEFTFSASFLLFRQYVNMFYNDYYMKILG